MGKQGLHHGMIGNKNRLRHGMSGTLIHHRWLEMKKRCLSPSNHAYGNYGGRGIKVCERWLCFENFLADMGLPPKGKSLDRINNDGDYCPENCRWTDSRTQCRNKRNNLILSDGETNATLTEWAEKTGISSHTIRTRIFRDGWEVKRALETPVGVTPSHINRIRNPSGQFAGVRSGR